MKSRITILSLILGVTAAHADGIDLHQFHPADNTRYITVESPTLSPADEDMAYLPELDHDFDKYYKDYYRRLFIQINADLLESPLVSVDANGNRNGRIIDSLTTMNLSVGYQFNNRFAIFADTSFSHVDVDAASFTGQSSQTVMGNSRLTGKFLVTQPNSNTNSFTFAFVPVLDIPTGNSAYYTTSGSLGYGLNLSAEQALGRFTITGNVGILISPNAIFATIDYQRQYPYSLGVLYRFTDTWGVAGEFSSALAATSNDYENHAEVFVGPRWRQSRDWTVLAELGTGHFKSDMSDDFRAVLQVKYTPFFKNADQQAQQKPAPTPIPPTIHVAEKFCPLESVTFANNKVVLSSEDKQKIREFASRIQDQSALPKITLIQVQGHASPVGPLSWNQTLSEERAIVSRDFLLELGIPEVLVETRAYSQQVRPRGNFKTHEQLMSAWRRAEFFCDYAEDAPTAPLTKAKPQPKVKPKADLTNAVVNR